MSIKNVRLGIRYKTTNILIYNNIDLFGTQNVISEVLVFKYNIISKSNLKLGGFIMKTLFTILMVALISATITADPSSKGDYLVTKDGSIVLAKVHFGFFKIHAKSDAGCILDADYKEVTSFKKNGETFVKKPLYNGKVNSGMVYMKLISWRNGLGLYSYEDPSLGVKDNKRYFVFKGENTFWLEVDSRNSETLRNFFSRI